MPWIGLMQDGKIIKILMIISMHFSILESLPKFHIVMLHVILAIAFFGNPVGFMWKFRLVWRVFLF